MSKVFDQSPSPRMHIKTLMRIGYTFNSAVSDIIDNSIAAKCKNISIYSPLGLDIPQLSIIDDGYGMSLEELIQNMRIGCKDPDMERSEGDLGRFGSGMKTASFSQARELTVITKKKGCPLVAARWDIDQIEETDSWCLEVFEENEPYEIEGYHLPDDIEQGTQIIWSKLTCFDSSSHGEDRDAQLANHLHSLKNYLSLYFHRYFKGKSYQKINIDMNNIAIEALDPFMSLEPGYQEGRSEKLRCKGGHVVIKTHVLPHINRISSEKLKKMGGAEGIAQNQGLYIYREGRLIIAGGWLGLAKNSQLGALARVQVDVPSALDSEWATDVKKSSLLLPPRIKKELRKFLNDPIKKSKRAYTYRGKRDAANKYWDILENENDHKITYQFDCENDEFRDLISSCDKEVAGKMIRYLGALSTALPINHIYEKMSEAPKSIDQEMISESLMEAVLKQVLESNEHE